MCLIFVIINVKHYSLKLKTINQVQSKNQKGFEYDIIHIMKTISSLFEYFSR